MLFYIEALNFEEIAILFRDHPLQLLEFLKDRDFISGSIRCDGCSEDMGIGAYARAIDRLCWRCRVCKKSRNARRSKIY